MTPKECKALERAFQSKQVKRTAPAATPLILMASTIDLLVVPLSASVDPPVALSPAPVSIGGEVSCWLLKLCHCCACGDTSMPEVVLMKVENITTMLDETNLFL